MSFLGKKVQTRSAPKNEKKEKKRKLKTDMSRTNKSLISCLLNNNYCVIRKLSVTAEEYIKFTEKRLKTFNNKRNNKEKALQSSCQRDGLTPSGKNIQNRSSILGGV